MSATHEADTGRASYELHHLPPHTETFHDYMPKNPFGGWGGGAAAGSTAQGVQMRRSRSRNRVSIPGMAGRGSRSGSQQGYAPSQSSSSHHRSNLPSDVKNAFGELRRHLGADSSENASVTSYRSSYTSQPSTDDTAEETTPQKRGKGDGPLRALKLDSIDSVDTGSAFETIVPQTYRVQQPQ
jgi:hypothetical protein